MAKVHRDLAGNLTTACDICTRPEALVYMVKEEIWRQAGFNDRSNVCPKCFMGALGRRPTPDDFVFCPCNQLVFLISPGAQIPEMKIPKDSELIDYDVYRARQSQKEQPIETPATVAGRNQGRNNELHTFDR